MLQRSHNSMPLPAGTAGEASQWVQLLPAGTFSGRDGAGPYTLDDPQGVIADTLAAASGADLPVDYDHQTLWSRENGRGAPAAGWIKRFEVRDGSVWAQVEWTPAAAARLRDREYRYLSPVFWHDDSGRILRVEHAALTNVPNLELEAVASRSNGGMMNPEQFAALLVALGLPANTKSEAVVAHAKTVGDRLKEMDAALAAMSKRLALPDGSTVRTIENAVDVAVTGLDETAKALGMEGQVKPAQLAANAKELVAAKKGQAETTDPDPTKWAPVSELQAMASRLAALEDGQAKEKAAEAVEAAMQAGKVTPGNKDWALAYASKDLPGFQAFAAAAPAIVKPGATGPQGQPPAADGQLGEEALAVCSQLGVSAEDYKRNIDKEVR